MRSTKPTQYFVAVMEGPATMELLSYAFNTPDEAQKEFEQYEPGSFDGKLVVVGVIIFERG